MAILFDDAASEHLEFSGTPPVTAAPFSFHCQFYSDDLTVNNTLFQLADKDVADHRFHFTAAGAVAGDPVNLFASQGATSQSATTTTGYSANTWHAAACTVASATDRRVFIGGGSKGTATTSIVPANIDRLSIGRRGDTTLTNYMSGRIAEPAFWNVALSDAEVAILAQGHSPLLMRPQNLVFYLPMYGLGSGGVQYDWIGGLAMTEANTPAAADHPPNIILPQFLDA